ncbi:MAG TPA: ribosome maturation factor RimM [Gaiellales bacterium]|nr:ribosome maturation factor RimM [Gaiellales bacterium]
MSRSPADTPWRPERIVIGRVGRPHGLDGSVHLDGHGGAVPVGAGTEVEVGGRRAVVVTRKGTAERPVVRLDLASDRAGAETLRGSEVTVSARALPPTEGDEYFHVDLIGCSVRAGDRELGTVCDVLAYPANDVLEVRAADDAEPVLVPFVEDVVTLVDVSRRVVGIREDFL